MTQECTCIVIIGINAKRDLSSLCQKNSNIIIIREKEKGKGFSMCSWLIDDIA